jgi:hypothetical protein
MEPRSIEALKGNTVSSMQAGWGTTIFVQHWNCPQDQNGEMCSGRGRCYSQNSCSCTGGSVGPNCEFFVCFELRSDNPTVCSSHGNCTSADTCNCNQGWYGENCGITSCFGYNSTDNLACSSQGECVGKDQCICPYPWIGQECGFTLIPLYVIPAVLVVACGLLVVLTMGICLFYYVMNSNRAVIEIEKLKEKIRKS